ncbi:hypothetical protein XAB3213_4530021 [Xanthomonas citri pv. bilvae]|nr:hypothetical protein XAB3213_4530021 [Xanthomonas citri pv. bilvae]
MSEFIRRSMQNQSHRAQPVPRGRTWPNHYTSVPTVAHLTVLRVPKHAANKHYATNAYAHHRGPYRSAKTPLPQ